MKKIGDYALNGCQNTTIEGLMGWPDNFIRERKDISAFLLKKRQERKYKLRKAQTINATQKHNPTMQVFLGVNELKQRDTKTHEVEPQTIADIAAIMGIGTNADTNSDS